MSKRTLQKNIGGTRPARTRPAQTRPATPVFTPVATRARHDGWTPERQVGFIDALAECACVEEAARSVGLSSTSAYNLRRHADAAGFRQAWDAALDYAVDRLADAALGRALRGVVRPVFYKGEQIGERRDYDERLTMFLLRHRRPESYGAWMDRREARCEPDARADRLTRARDRVEDEARADASGEPRAEATPIAPAVRIAGDRADEAEAAEKAETARADAEEAEHALLTAQLLKKLDGVARRLRKADEDAQDEDAQNEDALDQDPLDEDDLDEDAEDENAPGVPTGPNPRIYADFGADVAATSATSAQSCPSPHAPPHTQGHPPDRPLPRIAL